MIDQIAAEQRRFAAVRQCRIDSHSSNLDEGPRALDGLEAETVRSARSGPQRLPGRERGSRAAGAR